MQPAPEPSPSVPLEGAPLWLNALLILTPVAAGVVTAYLARGSSKPTRDTQATPSPPQEPPEPPKPHQGPPEPTGSAPTQKAVSSVDGKLDVAERYTKLLEEIRRDQDALIARQNVEITELRGRVEWLERQVKWLERFAPPPRY